MLLCINLPMGDYCMDVFPMLSNYLAVFFFAFGAGIVTGIAIGRHLQRERQQRRYPLA